MVSDSDSLFHNKTEDLTTTFQNDDRSIIRLGIVGHRYFASVEVTSFVARHCSLILKQARDRYHDVIAISAIAVGADTLFAEAALEAGIPLEIVRPFDEYVSDFENDAARARYERLRAAAQKEEVLLHKKRSNEAYQAAMHWIVMRSDLLLIAWDGLPAGSAGGTGDAIKQAIEFNIPWLHLDVTDLYVKSHTDGTSLNAMRAS